MCFFPISTGTGSDQKLPNKTASFLDRWTFMGYVSVGAWTQYWWTTISQHVQTNTKLWLLCCRGYFLDSFDIPEVIPFIGLHGTTDDTLKYCDLRIFVYLNRFDFSLHMFI
jgi:uncharacterized membrane protein YkvA (DUF1232 family)